MTTANVTALEVKALKNVIEGVRDLVWGVSAPTDYCCCYNECDVFTIADACDINERQAKGVLGSLIKKGLVMLDDEYDYINLTYKGVELCKELF